LRASRPESERRSKDLSTIRYTPTHLRGDSNASLAELFNLAAVLNVELWDPFPPLDERFLDPPT
jgi:hypothetical protein